MSKREIILYVEDALEAIEAVESYIDTFSFEDFREDKKHIVLLYESILL